MSEVSEAVTDATKRLLNHGSEYCIQKVMEVRRLPKIKPFYMNITRFNGI